jgi:O-antigen/teichoic acid export membrane protein
MVSHFISSLFFKHNSNHQILFKNTSWLTLAHIFSKIVKFVMVVAIARILGPAQFGNFSYILIFTAMCFMLSDIGLNLLIIREFPGSSQKKQLITTGAVIKLFLVGSNLIFAIVGYFFIEAHLQWLFIILTFMKTLDSLKQYNITVIRVNLRQEYEAISIIIETSITSILGVSFILIFHSITALGLAYFIGSLSAFMYLNIKTFSQIFPFEPLNTSLIMYYLKKMIPFIGTAFLYFALLGSDTLMIQWLLGPDTLGYYHSGLKIMETFLIIPMLYAIALYPLITKYKDDRRYIENIIKNSSTLLQLIAFPMIGGALLLAEPILYFLFSEGFKDGLQSFQFLLIVGLISFFTILFQEVLLGKQHEKKVLFANGSGFFINIILNLILIPRFGIIGAVMASIVGRLVILALFTRLIIRHEKIQPFLIKDTARYLFYTGIMIASVLFLQQYTTHLFLNISVGIIIYASLLIITRDRILLAVKNMFITHHPSASV